ncbi:MAG: TetR/AcrR family transcriptional regulator [Acidobacteriota bacterium]
MGPKERREREREEIRGRILDAARELFASEGYEAVTMRRIADRIEYSPTAIYFHFRDKEALLKELCATDFLSLARDLAGLGKVKNPIERLRRAGHAQIRFGATHPNHYRLMFMTPHPPMADDTLEKGNPEEDAYAFVRSIAVEAIEQKLLKPAYKDPHLVAQTVWAAVHGVISLEIAKQNDPWIEWCPLDKRSAATIDAVIAGIVR